MELHLPLPIIVVTINILDLDQRRHVFHDFSNLAEPIRIDHLQDFFIQQLQELSISLFLYFRVSRVDTMQLQAHLLD